MGWLSNISRDLRRRFYQLDLRGKITIALLAVVLPLGTVTTLTAYVVAYLEITEQTLALLQARAQLEQREIELRLASVLTLAESIAGNGVTANALADSHGREGYLVPLLRNQKLPIPGVSLTIVDYRGRAIASNVSPAPDHSQEPGFAAMMQGTRAQASVLQRPGQDAVLLAMLPIHYRLTHSIEGAVLLQIPLNGLLLPSTSADNRWLKNANGAPLAGAPKRQDAFEIDVPLALPEPLGNTGLVLVLARDRTQVLHTLNMLLTAFLAIGGLVVAGVVAFSRAGARFITTPLVEIADAAEVIATSGRPVATLPARRSDEFGRLAAAFNIMVNRLAESYADLENSVAKRTREYQESRLAAEKASNLLRESVSSIAQGFTIYDENDRLVLCNETYRNFYATSRDLIVPGNTFEEIVRGGAERGQYREAIGNVDEWVRQRVKAHQNANGQMIEQKLGDGRWLMIVEYRTPSGYIVGNRIDITELKNTAETLRQRELNLREHTEQLNAIFALSPDGFVSFDADHRVKYASPAFLHLTDLDEAEISGIDESVFSERLARMCLPHASFQGVAVLRSAFKAGPDIAAAGKRPEERRQVIELSGAGKRVLEIGLRLSQVETVSQILYVRDITHETEVDRLKSEFLTTAAHELRTPMASIYGFTELLLTQKFSEADQRDFLGTIFQQSELMVSIINELLDLARIEARRGKDFVMERIELGALLKQILTNQMTPQERPAPLQPPGDETFWVRADRSKLTQAISNVLSNAYKYSPSGGAVKIELIKPSGDLDTSQALIGISITDQGIGMTPAQLERVFERFYRADSSGTIPGTGLGMSIVKEIVELHGGRVEIDSVSGVGTTVTIWLPGESGINLDRRLS